MLSVQGGKRGGDQLSQTVTLERCAVPYPYILARQDLVPAAPRPSEASDPPEVNVDLLDNFQSSMQYPVQITASRAGPAPAWWHENDTKATLILTDKTHLDVWHEWTSTVTPTITNITEHETITCERFLPLK